MSPYSFNVESLNTRLHAFMDKYKDLPEDAEVVLTKKQMIALTTAVVSGSILEALSDPVDEAREMLVESLEELEE